MNAELRHYLVRLQRRSRCFHAVSRRLGAVSSCLSTFGIGVICIGDNIHLAMLTLSTSYVVEFYHSRALHRKILYFGKFPQNTVDRTMLLSFLQPISYINVLCAIALVLG